MIIDCLPNDPNNKTLEAYSADTDILSVTKIPYSSQYVLQFADRGELVEVSNDSVRNIDTWRTEQERIDGANRRLAKCGLGCFPVLNICPICNETIMTSSSLPLLPGVLELDSENRVTHYHCLMGTDECEHKNFTAFWFKHEFKGKHRQNLMAKCSECPVTWHLKETAENMVKLLAAEESDE